MSLPILQTDDEILRNAGIHIILTTAGVLEIRVKLYDTFILIHSLHGSSVDDKNSLIRRLVRQPNQSKMSALIEAQAKVWKRFV